METELKNQGLYDPKHEHDACGIGAVVNISGKRTHAIMEYGKEILVNLHHRGAAGADDVTGDGAGILFQIPHDFFASECKDLGLPLPAASKYGVGMIFNPKCEKLRKLNEQILEDAISYHGMKVLGWRDVPVSNECLGEIALESEPSIRQIFVDGAGLEQEALERKLFLARKRAERISRENNSSTANNFYVASLSSRTICYKGMFMAWQLFEYYPDLQNKDVKSGLAIVHQRYSTNTFPSWELAQPLRCVAHNGEINTLSGNRTWMTARQPQMSSEAFGRHIDDLFPVLDPDASDSACFDNTLELLVRSGRTLPHSMMMLVPEAFGPKYHISTDKRAFYEYHASFMEPWDGPAAMIFTDGERIGGTLDRNGLRPCRYLVTTDGLAVIGSEAGVVNFPPEKIRQKGRLRPGHMFLIDTKEGRIVSDGELKNKIARGSHYRKWIENNRIELRGFFDTPTLDTSDPESIVRRMRMFGYTREELKMILTPMGVNGQEPIGSMGNDTPFAVLSDKPKLLYNYFKQLFAQVTNPAIDPLREGLVMSLMMYVGRKPNLLTETPEHCRQLKLHNPVLTNEDIDRLRSVTVEGFGVTTIPAVFEVDHSDPEGCLRRGLKQLTDSAEAAARDGASLLIISDRGTDKTHAPIPSLLGTAAVHNSLLNCGLRHKVGLIVESGEPREVMHFCLLCGFGASAVNPYMGFDVLSELHRQGAMGDKITPGQVAENYIAAIKKGILKTMSKMGISTLRSYYGAQLFEAIGLSRDFVDEYFTGISSRIGGIGLEGIATETITNHTRACKESGKFLDIDFGGEYQYRHTGEKHLWNPTTVSRLQHAVVSDDPEAFTEYVAAVNSNSANLCTLRGLFEFVPGDPVPLDEVESADKIVKRFCTGAMSQGSISKEAHECMAVGMNRLGAMSNTGEGGENESRFTPEPNGDSKNSAIKQVASGRFGVTNNYLANAKELQIKISQGAKPGEGGQLPGHKVTAEIAAMRHSTPGVTLISPPPHHDIYSIEDIAQLIYDLRCSNPEAKISVKLVSEVGVGTIAAGVVKGNADEVLISGHDGGTGASPLSSIKHAGAPWELGVAETQQVLVANGLRSRVRLQADGQMKTGRDIVVAALLGAEQFGFGTVALVAMGCTLLRKCHEGACPFGIGTQDPEFRKRFAGKPEYIERLMTFIAEDVRKIMSELGFRKFEDMIGQVGRLQMQSAIDHWKARGLDFSQIFHKPATNDPNKLHLTKKQACKLDDHIDWKIIEKAKPAIEDKTPTVIKTPIRNTNRTAGGILSNHIAKHYGSKGLPDGTLEVMFAGSAGQSFGAFLPSGVTFKLIGESNDYLGKSLSGGRIIVKVPDKAHFIVHENVIVGNTLLYGATQGEAFINGTAGERFAVRNSGATAVVEGVGDHGCEYMTGGTVVVLGKTGCNFAAGMSGGIAYVLDEAQLFDTMCNLDMVELESVWKKKDKDLLQDLIKQHLKWADSTRAKYILDRWDDMVGRFVKVVPTDYRKALEKMRAAEHRHTETTPATEEVFRV